MAVTINDPVSNFTHPTIDPGRKKLIWAFLPVLLLVLGLGVTLRQVSQRQQLTSEAGGGVVLSFLVTQNAVKPGDIVDVDVFLDARKQAVTTADLYLVYDHQKLEALGITPSDFLPELLEEGIVGPGSAFIKVGNPTAKTGLGSIAKLRFKALDSGKAALQFSEETLLVNRQSTEEMTNLIDKAINLNLVID